MQGIAARYAMRVASSAKAKDYAVLMKPYAEIGWIMIEALIEKQEEEKEKVHEHSRDIRIIAQS